MYTRDMSAMTSLVENAKQRYLETSRPNVVVHTADQVGHDNFETQMSKTDNFSFLATFRSILCLELYKE